MTRHEPIFDRGSVFTHTTSECVCESSRRQRRDFSFISHTFKPRSRAGRLLCGVNALRSQIWEVQGFDPKTSWSSRPAGRREDGGGNMRNPVTVVTTLLSVEFVLYTMSLCSPQWLVQIQGASEGLFALCSAYAGSSSCTTFPAWLGKHPSSITSPLVYNNLH